MDLTHHLIQETLDESNPNLPLYHGTRTILGLYDLVISFKTNPCPFSCNFCGVSKKIKVKQVAPEELSAQVEFVLKQYAAEFAKLQRVTVRNESSVLDSRAFYPQALQEMIEYTHLMPQLKEISLETRLEYLTQPKVERLLQLLPLQIKLDLTVGFETQDERILNEVLGKRIDKNVFEEKVRLLGQFSRTKLTAYVMLKPDPMMTEEAGVIEAINSVDYLQQLSQSAGVSLVVYVNPTYAAPESKLFALMQKVDYHPPKEESLRKVMDYARRKGVMVYTD